MQELWPRPTIDLDIVDRLAGDERPPKPDRPWVTLVMITSIDGAIALQGTSGGLGNDDDHDRFVAARSMADGIIVGASTVAVEDYKPAGSPIAVITGSLSPDPDAALFGDPARPPLLFTTESAAAEKGSRFVGKAEVVAHGDTVDPAVVLADLKDRGMHQVVLEGGPTINSLFLAQDLVDEMLISVSPSVVGGPDTGITGGEHLPDPLTFTVDRVLLGGDLIFVRYLRDRDE